MMKNKACAYTEPGDIETLYFQPSLKCAGDEVTSQSVAIAPLKNRETSMIFAKWYKNFPHVFAHIVFTEEETDMLINALMEVKNRWKTGKVIA